jgi:hypothetical protein
VAGKQSNRTTIRLPDAVHKRLKIIAAERGTTMQDLLETALTHVIEGGLDRESTHPQDEFAIPPHLEKVVKSFVTYWQRPLETPTDRQIRRLIETVIGMDPKQRTIILDL